MYPAGFADIYRPVAEQAKDGFRVLVVDDEKLYARSIRSELERRGIGAELAFCAEEALQKMVRAPFQAVLLDHRLPDRDGISLIPQLLAHRPDATVVVMTAYHGIPSAVSAIRAGAEDYIVKEPSIAPILERVEEIRRRHLAKQSAGWDAPGRTEGLLGSCPRMRQVIEQIERLATSPDTTVLITGETGVGKEVAARMLHRLSRPAGSPFVAVDCASLPANLAESILFGHEKGAFTGAEEARAGALEEAGAGTVFLDEIGELGSLQAKLLRVLEMRQFSRVGSAKLLPLRGRVVAATNHDLERRVREGLFRQDLYQRLCVFPIQLPPLRERGEDILLLAEHFREHFSRKLGKAVERIDEKVRGRLRGYAFPGNVRELKNIMERAVILAEGDCIEYRHLPQRVQAELPEVNGDISSLPLDFKPGVDTLNEVERRLILHVLERTGGKKSQAARLLGISRFQLLRRMERHGIRLVQAVAEEGEDA